MKKYFLVLSILALLVSVTSCKTSTKVVDTAIEQQDAKHEFRGAWIQTAWQDRYQNKTPEACRQYLKQLVETLYQTGFNAVVFQVRPEGDAFYHSNYEPWSRFLTGVQGKAPSPDWDPMEYLIELCHSHGMEFHAWINPYRMYMSKNFNLASNHLYREHPEYFVIFDERLYLNPGLPESRAWIRSVVTDIVKRYDVDAIHMDDYFYPYPVAGKEFNDIATFQAYAPQMGYNPNSRTDLGAFRRRSVNILIKSVHDDIRALKPWVRFGISPFGIYRNEKSWEGGSKTNGTQCYDDLYADVLLWAQSGWIDYVVPQLYWEIGHKAADYTTLCSWWTQNIPAPCQLYIGQSIERSLDGAAKNASTPSLLKSSKNFLAKINQARGNKRVLGNCFWYAYQVEDNEFGVRDFLKQSVFQTHAMPPAFKNLDDDAPDKVRELDGSLVRMSDKVGLYLKWAAPKADKKDVNDPVLYYNVYRFAKGESVNTRNMDHLCAQVSKPEFLDFGIGTAGKYTYVVTAVDHYNNEGLPMKKVFKIKLK